MIENIRLFADIYGLARRQAQQRMAWIVEMAGLSGYEHDRTGRLPMGCGSVSRWGAHSSTAPGLVPGRTDVRRGSHRPSSILGFADAVGPRGRRRDPDHHPLSERSRTLRPAALMYAGHIVAEGTPADLKTQVEHEVGQLLEIAVDKPGAALAQVTAAGFTGAALFGTKIHVLSRDPSRDEARLREVLGRADTTVAAVRPRMLSLEDVFVSRVMALEQAAQKKGRPEPATHQSCGASRSGRRPPGTGCSSCWPSSCRLSGSWCSGTGSIWTSKTFPIAVLDRDQSEFSRGVSPAVHSVAVFFISRYAHDEHSLDRLLTRNEDSGSHHRPRTVSGTIGRRRAGRRADIAGWDLSTAYGYRQGLRHRHQSGVYGGSINRFSCGARAASPGASRRPRAPLSVEVRYLYNEEVRSTWSMVPALVMFTLMLASPLLTALGVVREKKETGSIYNIYSSTVSRAEFLTGKLLPTSLFPS